MQLVFVHGLSASSRWWRDVLPLLGGRRARLLDLPRFGQSFRPEHVVDWLAGELEPDAPVVLVGHSLGGLVCASLAAARPDLVEALVLVAPVGAPSARSLRAYATGLARTFIGARLGLLRTIAGDAMRTGPEALLLGARFATETSFAGRIGAPTLLIWGARDSLIPVELAAEWQLAIPGSRLEVIDGAAHVPMVETPLAFAERLLQFLDDLGDHRGV
ncbi:MAG: alpha/beta fold hydrolase [Actinobacteria bacterium]|nr:alpha/beta fold hydrolase [Actinomycetota bacterium]